MADKILVNTTAVNFAVKQIAHEINRRAWRNGYDVAILGVSTAALYLTADVSRRLHVYGNRCKWVGLVDVASYVGSTQKPPVVTWLDLPPTDLVPVVLDVIVDTGATLRALRDRWYTHFPAEGVDVYSIVRRVGLDPSRDCPGWNVDSYRQVPDGWWLYGYGLDGKGGYLRQEQRIRVMGVEPE